MKDSLILHTEHKEQIEALSMEQRGALLTAMLCYQTDDNLPEMDALTAMCFAFIRQRIDRDNAAYEEKSRRNAKNVRKRWNEKEIPEDAGGKKSYCETIPVDTSGTSGKESYYERIPDDTSDTSGKKWFGDPDPDPEPDPDIDPDLDKEREKGATPLKRAAKPQGTAGQIEAAGYGPELEAAVKDWVQYKTERRQAYKPTGLSSLLSKIAKEAAAHGDKAVVEAIQEAMANGWQGIVWERIGGRSPNDRDRIANRVREVDTWDV